MRETNDRIARLIHDHFSREVAAVPRAADSQSPGAEKAPPTGGPGRRGSNPALNYRPTGTSPGRSSRRVWIAAAAALLLALPVLMPLSVGTLRPLAVRIDAAWSSTGRAVVARALEEAHEVLTLRMSEQEE